MNTIVHLSFLFTIFAFFRSRFSGSYDSIVLFFSFWGNSILIAVMAVPINIPTNSTQWFLFLHVFIFLLFVVFLMTVILTGIGGISLWFSLELPWKLISDVELLFVCLLYHCMSPGKMSTQAFQLVFNWIVCLIDFELYKCLKEF